MNSKSLALRTKLLFGVAATSAGTWSCSAPESYEEESGGEVAAALSPQLHVPVRIVEAYRAGTSSCASVGSIPTAGHGVRAWYDEIDEVNRVWAPGNVDFWLKSVERVCLDALTRDATYDWSEIKAEMAIVFPGASAAAWDGERRSVEKWLRIAQAVFGDDDVSFVWYSPFSLDGSSNFSLYPSQGNLTYVSSDRLEHELSHSLGLEHPHESLDDAGPVHYADRALTLADRWDLIYCDSVGGPRTFAGPDGVAACPAANIHQKDWHASVATETLTMPFGSCNTNECIETIGSGPRKGWWHKAELLSGSMPSPPAPRQVKSTYRSCQGDGVSEVSCGLSGTVVGRDTLVTSYVGPNPLASGQWITAQRRALDGLTNSDPVNGDAVNAVAYTWPGVGWEPLNKMVAASQIDLARGHLQNSIALGSGMQALFHQGQSSSAPLLGGVSGDDLTSKRASIGHSPSDYLWSSNGDFSFAGSVQAVTGGPYQPVVGDFDANGWEDILWYDQALGRAKIWFTKGIGFVHFRTFELGLPAGYQAIAGNFDGQSGTDVLFYAPGSAPERFYWSNGTMEFGTFPTSSENVSTTYTPVVGNFDGALGDDIFWYRSSTGAIVRWISTGDRHFTSSSTSIGSGPWTPVVGNFQPTNQSDIFWYRAGASCPLWYFNGGSLTPSVVSQTIDNSYAPFAGDFNGDGIDDVFWDAVGSGTDYLWAGIAGNAFDKGSNLTQMLGSYRSIAGNFGYGRSDCRNCDDVFWYKN